MPRVNQSASDVFEHQRVCQLFGPEMTMNEQHVHRRIRPVWPNGGPECHPRHCSALPCP